MDAPVYTISVDDYVKGLVEYLKRAHREVFWTQDAAREQREMETGGHISYELEVGDHCAMRLPDTHETKRYGPRKFFERTRPEVWVVAEKPGPNTYRLRNIHSGHVDRSTHHGRNLVKLEFVDVPVEPGQKRVMEIYNSQSGEWERHVIERFATDGRLSLQKQVPKSDGMGIEWGNEDKPFWADPSELQYRWVA